MTIPAMPGLLTPECTRAHVGAQSRKRALETAAELLAARHPALSAREIFEELMRREELGSTGIGEGVAIPHCRVDTPRVLAAFLRLEKGIDYEAIDDAPVDLLFVLVVPRDEADNHLEVLAALAGVFSDEANRSRLRLQTGDAELHATMTAMLAAAPAR